MSVVRNYLFITNSNGATSDVLEWISYTIPQFTGTWLSIHGNINFNPYL